VSWPPGREDQRRDQHDERGAREHALERICRRLLTTRNSDDVWLIWQTIGDHVTDDWLSTLVQPVAARRRNRALRDDAETIVNSTTRALRAAIRFHKRAQREKWYGRAGNRLDGPAPRPWRRYPAMYARVLTIIASDLALHPPAITARRGDPAKSRNAALRRDLESHGLKEKQIDAILSAIGFPIHGLPQIFRMRRYRRRAPFT
jgi:hypothetical protein